MTGPRPTVECQRRCVAASRRVASTLVDLGLAHVDRRHEGDVRRDPPDVGIAGRPAQRVDLDRDRSAQHERDREVPAGHGRYRSPRRRGQSPLVVVA